MATAKEYIQAAIRENTKKSYSQAVKHFEVDWKGKLPTTPEHFGNYLSYYADKLSFATLKSRQAAISEWHNANGFPNPTKNQYIKKIMRGIYRSHGKRQKQVEPTSIEEIKEISKILDQEILDSYKKNDNKRFLVLLRNRAVVSLLFWQAYRPSEVVKIDIENIKIRESSLEIFINETKNTSQNKGAVFNIPSTPILCPVNAVKDWILNSGLVSGPIFRKIDKHGSISKDALNVGSLSPMIKNILRDCGLPERSAYTFRRGFATWAAESGWTVKELMEYVNWKDRSSAERYIENKVVELKNKIEISLIEKN